MSNIYYTESTPISASSGNVAAAAATATITAGTKMAYINGFAVTGAGATAASVIAVTVTGVVGGTQRYNMAIPAGAAVAVTPLIVNFPMPLSATGYGTDIVVSAASFGAGNTNAAVVAYGFLK